MWKYNSPVVIVSYCLKPNKNILLVSSAHNELDACKEAHKTPVSIELYNSQRCGVDTLNQMICEYPCQPM